MIHLDYAAAGKQASAGHPGELAMADHHESEDSRLLHRTLFFTDAVFAIVLTLLVLELRPPEARTPAEAIAGLAALAEHFIAFLMSFALVSVFWVAHLNTLRRLQQFDWTVAIVNLVFLLPICLLPFSSSLLGVAKFGFIAWRFYSWNLIATSLAMVALAVVVTRDEGRLTGGLAPRERAYRAVRAAAPGVAFAVSLALMESGQTLLARLALLLIFAQFLLAERFLKHRPKPTPTPLPAAEAS